MHQRLSKMRNVSSRKQGYVDVLARKGAESFAIDVETGKSDVVWNVRQDLISQFTRVIVVATDEGVLLGTAGPINEESVY